MGFYERLVLPRLIHLAMQRDVLQPYRYRVVAGASGRVLEIGAGSGLNLSLYAGDVESVLALDSSPQLLAMARRQRRTGAEIDLIEASAARLPLCDASIDTAVTTWTLCSIADVNTALREVRRVLKPSGALRFVEHGRAPDPSVQRWQDWLTPAWKRLAGGCHLNRPIRGLLEEAGFTVERLDTGYMEGPRPMTFTYEGVARRG
jgi:ubiquinone/menaquinone biosynthesis C-methylase UbiE